MDLISNLALGFGVALAPVNLLMALLGCVLGTLMGVLPGIGPVAAMAMLLPVAYTLDPVTALILLACIYCGAQIGGTSAAILAQRSGNMASGMTGIEGWQMAQQGRAGPALAAAALAAFIAGCVGTLILAVVAPTLATLALQFGSAEFLALMVLALMGVAVLTPGSLIKSLGMAVLGLLLGLVGTDADAGLARFAFDVPEVSHGVGFVVVAMGVFGYGPIMANLARPRHTPQANSLAVQSFRPTSKDLQAMAPAVFRGTVLGSLVGMVPGGTALLASIASYALEKKTRTKLGEVPMGQGNIRGVAAPGSAAHASIQTAFIALLALGVPSTAVMALLLGAMMLHNIQPGPEVIIGNPPLFWGLVAALWVGNLMLALLNLPLIGVWKRLLGVPYRWLFPLMVLLCAMGAYTIKNSALDIWLVALFGVVGYMFSLLEMPPAPLILGFILGPMMEEHLRQALFLSRGDWSVFVSRPLSAGLLAIALVLLFLVSLPASKLRRHETFPQA